MKIYRNLTPNITKGQKGSKRVKKSPKYVKKLYKLKIPIVIPFMSAIFSTITQFIYVHMTVYRKLTHNITKGQKRVKKCPKEVKKWTTRHHAQRPFTPNLGTRLGVNGLAASSVSERLH